MKQVNIVNEIVKMSNTLVFINKSYSSLKKNSEILLDEIKIDHLQKEISVLRNQLSHHFPAYCGLILFKEELKLKCNFRRIQLDEDNLLIDHYNLLLQLSSQLKTIKASLTASTNFKSIFIKLDTICEAQLHILNKAFTRQTVESQQNLVSL